MSFQVAIAQAGRSVSVEIGDTILAAALAQGVAYPHGCRSGNCGGCKSRLLSGEVELSPYSEYALSAAERADGLILACRAVPWEDCAVAWLDEGEVAIHPRRELTCTVAALTDLTHDIKGVELAIRAGGPFTYSAGQYASLRFPGQAPRDYSMAAPPGGDRLEFHIRRLGAGGCSDFVARRLRVGDEVRVTGPLGTAHLREAHRGPILAIAGGSGLAPIKAIVEAALAGGTGQPIHLYFGARTERDIYLEGHFRALARRSPNLRYTPVLSEPGAAPVGAVARRRGYVGDVALADMADLDGIKAYLAGPPVMVERTTALLRERGMPAQDIHADAFYTEAEKPGAEKPAGGLVAVAS